MPVSWEKADFDANYRFRVERRMPGGGPRPDEGRNGVDLHYHKLFMEPLLANRWAVLAPILNIDSSEHVVMVGAGFGWGVDALIAETGATIVGVDISQYIADEQGNTEEAEARAAIATDGLDPDTGRGAEILAFVQDGSVRSNVVILQESAQTNGSRQAIRAALGGNNPSVAIADDIIDDDWTDTDILNLRNGMNGFGGTQRLIFVYSKPTTRTYQDLLNLLPGSAEVISTDGTVYLVK